MIGCSTQVEQPIPFLITIKILDMKNIIIISVFLLILIFGCKKKKVEPLYGTISSLLFDGKPIQREGTKLQILAYNTSDRCKISQYGIQIFLRSFNDTLIETISVSDLPMMKTGIISLAKGFGYCDTIPEVSFTMDRYADLQVASYGPLKNFDNYVNILSFDNKTKEVKGQCKLTLVNNTYSQYQKQFGYRDTIVFESGDFTVRLQ